MIDLDAQMAGDDAREENEGDSQRDAEDLQPSQIDTDGRDEAEHDNGLRERLLVEQID